MDGCSASAGSCTTARPPARINGSQPGGAVVAGTGEYDTDARGPYAAAAERNSGSTAGRCPCTVRSTCEHHPPVNDQQMVVHGRHIDPAGEQGLAVDRRGRREGPEPRRICGSALGAERGTCSTTRIAAGRSTGSPPTSAPSASTPPADAPTTTTSRRAIAVTPRAMVSPKATSRPVTPDGSRELPGSRRGFGRMRRATTGRRLAIESANGPKKPGHVLPRRGTSGAGRALVIVAGDLDLATGGALEERRRAYGDPTDEIVVDGRTHRAHVERGRLS